jgi:putative oxidoreductase
MMIVGHGWGKLMRIVSWNWEFADPIGIGAIPSLILATFAEFFCSAAVIAGFKTRLAAIPLLITMLVAALVQHGADPFSRKELPLLYAAVFLTIILIGPGRYSLDKS